MLVFDPDEKPVAVRRKFMDGVYIDIFPTSRTDRRRIRKEARDQAENDPEKEETIYETLLRRHMCRGWSGFVDSKGKPLEFSTSLIDPLFNALSALELFVTTESSTLALARAKEKARKLKNLNSSPDGSEPGPPA